MASERLTQSASDQTNSGELDRHLEEAFHMPTPQWWESVHQSFSRLQELFRPKSDALLHEELDEDADEYTISARLARAASLPSIILLPSGNHALGLAATNEPLQCTAFGTVGPKVYIELFWEAIAEAQESGHVNIMVHEILQESEPRILLRLETHIFELNYIQCEALVRNCPTIIDAEAPFLKDRNNCNAKVQEAVEKLQRGRKVLEKSKDSPDCRRAYYYERAWAITWGLFDGDKNARDVFEACAAASQETSGDFSSIISEFMERWSLHYPQTAQYQSNDWNQLLSRLEVEPLPKRLDYPYYLQVTVLYTGSSNAQGAAWLSMVERKLVWLKERLEARIPLPANVSVGAIPRIRIWPRRLTSAHSDPEDGIYEGCFVLGLDIDESTVPTVADVAERWKLQRQEDDLTVRDRCFIDVIICRKSDIEKQDLKPCTRDWPRPIVKAEEGQKQSRPPRLSKHEKKRSNRNHEHHGTKVDHPEAPASVPQATKKLRTASDVLNRLRYDSRYKIDEFVVGYKDRHTLRIMEKPAAEWAKDTTDEEFIPEHRIEYFKQYSPGGNQEILWDKSSRLDRIFQHGGNRRD